MHRFGHRVELLSFNAICGDAIFEEYINVFFPFMQVWLRGNDSRVYIN